MLPSKRLAQFLVLGVLLLIVLAFNHQYLSNFPEHIHAWAQADRYALALGYMENGHNLLHPQTFVLNKQFPDNWQSPYDSPETATDLPIPEYLIALIMRLSGSTAPLIFRLFILCCALTGGIYLFKLSKELIGNSLMGLFVVLFVFSTPVFLYYSTSFLPSIPCWAMAVVAMYHYHRYTQGGQPRSLWLAMLFLTLAALTRTTFLIPLLAVLGTEFIRMWKSHKPARGWWIPILISCTVLIMAFVWKTIRFDQVGSIFLGKAIPAGSISKTWEMVEMAWSNWAGHYASIYHVLLIALLFPFIALALKRGPKREYITVVGTLALGGALAFLYLMAFQLPAHDYYFIDTLLLPVTFLLIGGLAVVRNLVSRPWNNWLIAALLLLTIPMFLAARQVNESRHETGPWDRINQLGIYYHGADLWLDEVGVPNDSRILVLGCKAPNLPFIHMQRNGYAIRSNEQKEILSSLDWPHEYVTFDLGLLQQDDFISPTGVFRQLKPLKTNGKVVLCQNGRSKTPSLRNAIQNLKLPLVHEQRSSDVDSLIRKEFWSTIDIPTRLLTNRNQILISLECEVMTDLPSKKAYLVFSIKQNGEQLHYKAEELKQFVQRSLDWGLAEALFWLPEGVTQNAEMKCYLWDPDRTVRNVRNAHIQVYQMK